MANSTKTVGVVGLGIMGGSFARNLVDTGWRVVGYDVDPAPPRDWRAPASRSRQTSRRSPPQVPAIITSLPKPSALDATVAAIAAARLSPKVIVEASTFTLDDKEKAERALRKAGHIMLDCPVSGTGAQARDGDLVVYASGDSKAISKLKPLFAGFARARPTTSAPSATAAG